MTPVLRASLWMITGCVLLTCALLIPAHFRGVDVKLLERAGAGTPSLVQTGASYLSLEKIAAAGLLWRAAEMLAQSGHQDLGASIGQAMRAAPPTSPPGNGGATLEDFGRLFRSPDAPPIIDVLMEPGTRETALKALQDSRRPGVQEILQNRLLTNTVEFPPAMSAAGQPLEAVIALTALLSQTDLLPAGLREKIEFLAAHANGGGSVEPLETVYLDLLSLGQRLEGSQLVEFARRVEDTTVFHDLTEAMRTTETQLPILFAAVALADQPSRVAQYLTKFPKTGLGDLGTALSHGKGALGELLRRQHRIYAPKWRLGIIGYDPFGAFFYAMLPASRTSPGVTMLLKCFVLLAALFCFARALVVLVNGPPMEALEPHDHTRFWQDFVLALCVFAVALFTIEPFIVSETAKTHLPIRLQRPVAGTVAGSAVPKTTTTNQLIMSSATLASLLLFFVLQGLIYIWCLAKISEIRRQAIEPRIKLRLLENEEHLFDAGLYLGLVGTIISLIVFSLGMVKPSLMAAYSSTSFGIIFVSVLKIFHLRPLRRQLILESEPLS